MIEQVMEHVVSAFLDHVRRLYCEFVQTLIKKFQFQSTLLSDLQVLNPAEWLEYKHLPNAVIQLAK